ncbi:purine permease [Alkalinema sp. FACHB-956]|nr:purine permease [Alkalinema sp. FACHB-956]
MKKSSSHASELNPPDNITPSFKSTMTGILTLLPLIVLLVGLYSGAINP